MNDIIAKNDSGFLAKITKARQALEMASSVEEVLDIRDKAKAIQEYVKASGESLEVQNRAAEIRLRSERKAGKLLKGMGLKPGPKGNAFTLKGIGINETQSHRYQQLASVPEKDFEKHVEETLEKKRELTQSSLLKLAKGIDSDRQRKTRSDKQAELRGQFEADIRQGDFRVVLSDVADVSAIITDPPYGKFAIELWGCLGEFAAESLATNGVLIAYSGQMFLPDVLNALGKHLDYWWTLCVVHQGSGNITPLGHPVRKVINNWKPLVFFTKKGANFSRVFRDLVPSEKPNKEMHNWAQPVSEASWLIEAFSEPGDLIVDPFAGSGTVGKAALECGRQFIGAEVLT